MAPDAYDSFEAVKVRLDEIVDAVSNDGLELDAALALYEEAVGLGLRASDLLEENIEIALEAEKLLEEAGEESAEPSSELISTPLEHKVGAPDMA